MRAYELVADEPPRRRRMEPFESEGALESLLEELLPLLLNEEILLIGQQVSLDTGTLDLLGLDKYGNGSIEPLVCCQLFSETG